LDKFQGFYGLIGPDIEKTKIKSLYQLFTGDGMIQGIFFKDGEHTYKKYEINTEKRKFAEKFGEIPQNIATTTLLYCMNKMNIIPNLLGRANTAFMKTNHSIYALFERDLPYEIDIHFEKQIITTKSRVSIPHINTFSAHSKIINDKIHTIDYDILHNRVSYFQLDPNTLDIIKKAIFPTTYLPVIHDFLVLNDSILIIDSPFYFDFSILFSSKIPVSFNNKNPTKIHIYNLSTDSIQTVQLPYGIFLFHYAEFGETDTHIEFYGSIYENIHFSNIELFGKYRKMIINKVSNTVEIESDSNTDNYNLDFPVHFENEKNEKRQILLNFQNGGFNGFVLLEKLKIKKEILWKERKICGEPAVVFIENHPFLIGFSYDSKSNGYFFYVDLDTFKKEEIPLNEKMTIGFHSLFLSCIS